MNLITRWAEEFPGSSINDLLVYIGKMHLQNHCESCQYLFSLYFALGVGRLDGEELERFWAEANQIARSTKQMNPGHRIDTIDDMINDWNKTKQFVQGSFSYICINGAADVDFDLQPT